MGVVQADVNGSFNLNGVMLSPGKVDVDGGDGLILDADGDSGFKATTDDQIEVFVGGATDFTFTSNSLTADSASKFAGSGSCVVPMFPIATEQRLSGAGAIGVTQYFTAWTTTSADAATLADGASVGQLKKILMVVDGGDGTLTPDHLSGGTTIIFADAGDYVVLMWNGTSWVLIESGNTVDGVTAPVIA